MAAIRGGPAGPDGVGGDYDNEVETDRAAWWHALGGVQGILKGLAWSQVAGQLALDMAPGAALVSERDGSGQLQDRGYFTWTDETVRVSFGPPSVSSRNDALVVAFVDTEDGPVGSGAPSVGPQIISVPGVSGTTTPRTDAQITAYLGRGGWVRVADVPVVPGDTQVNVANMVTATNVRVGESGVITDAFTAGAGWTLSQQKLIRRRNMTFFSVVATRTGGAINVGGGATGDITNVLVASFNANTYPVAMTTGASTTGTGRLVGGYVDSAGALGTLNIANAAGSNNIGTGENISLSGCWPN